MAYRNGIVTFGTNPPSRVIVSIPGNLAEMERGLQRFHRLKPDEGMLFTSRRWPDEEVIPMWMASVSYPLAMVWISKNGFVSAIEDYVQPGDRRTFNYRGVACVELNAGTPDAVGMDVGTPASLEVLNR